MKKPDYYSILGIPRTATLEEIRNAYFRAARQYHPDLNTMPGDTEYFISAQEAFDTLSNQEKRKQYDETLPPLKDPVFPIGINVVYSRNHLVKQDEPQLVYTLIKLIDPQNTKAANINQSVNLCLVIDRSSSMGGSKLDYAKASAIQLIKRLRSQDSFSLVAFNDKPEIITGKMGSKEVSRFESKIFSLLPSGGTEIFQGLTAGYSEILRNFAPFGINQIILLTDGRTYGDEELCLDLAQQAAKNGIGITGLGIGPDWNDNFMDALTTATGGNSYFVSNPEEISAILLKRFEQFGHYRAQNLSLTYMDNPSSLINYSFRLHPDPGLLKINSPIMLGPFLDSTDLSILLEFIVRVPSDSTTMQLLDGNINIVEKSHDPTPPKLAINLKLPIQKKVDFEETPPQEIVNAISELTFYRMQEHARNEVVSGEYEQAISHLQKVATHALQKGDSSLYKLISAEVESIKNTHALTSDGEKKIKFGTRALFNPGTGDESP